MAQDVPPLDPNPAPWVNGVGSAPKPKPTTLADVVARWKAQGPLVHIATGIPKLDELTEGGPVLGSRWYLLGAPDAGKTALLVQFGHVWASALGMVVGYHAVDEEDGDIATRFAQRMKFSRRDCEDRGGEIMREMAEAFAALPNVFFYSSDWTIEAAAEDLHERTKIIGHGSVPARAALFIDSIQQVSSLATLPSVDLKRELSPREVVNANVKAVRHVATKYQMIVMATSEMNRNAYRSIESAELSNDMAAGKESGAIEFSARVMLSLRSVKDHGDLVQMRIVKNKHGPSAPNVGDVFLGIDRRRMTLDQAEAPDEPAADEARSAKGQKETAADAAKVAVLLAERPGTRVRDARDALKARYGSFSKDRLGPALAKLASAVVSLPGGPGRPTPMYLDGSRVPPEVLMRVPAEMAPTVVSARPPAGTP